MACHRSFPVRGHTQKKDIRLATFSRNISSCILHDPVLKQTHAHTHAHARVWETRTNNEPSQLRRLPWSGEIGQVEGSPEASRKKGGCFSPELPITASLYSNKTCSPMGKMGGSWRGGEPSGRRNWPAFQGTTKFPFLFSFTSFSAQSPRCWEDGGCG